MTPLWAAVLPFPQVHPFTQLHATTYDFSFFFFTFFFSMSPSYPCLLQHIYFALFLILTHFYFLIFLLLPLDCYIPLLIPLLSLVLIFFLFFIFSTAQFVILTSYIAAIYKVTQMRLFLSKACHTWTNIPMCLSFK